MELTKYTHSSVRMEHDGHVLAFDPGNFAPEGEHAQLLDGADYLLITHEHPVAYLGTASCRRENS